MKALFTLVLMLGTVGWPFAQRPDVLQERVDRFFAESRHRVYYLHTDRKLYAPGDKVWFQVYALDSRARKPHTGRESLTLVMTTSEGSELQFAPTTLEKGSGTGSLTVPTGISEGIYALELRDGETTVPCRMSIGIRKKAVPSFIITLEITNELLIPGEEVSAVIRFTGRDSEPLRRVSFGFHLNDGSGEHLVHTGTTDASGTHTLRFQVPRNLDAGMLGFGISASYRGETEILQGALRVATQQVYLRLMPEGGALIAGIQNHVAYQAVDAYGNPFPFRGEVKRTGSDSGIRLASDSGIGSFMLTPELGAQYYVRITHPYPIDRPFALEPATAGGMSIRLVERKERALVITLKNANSKAIAGKIAARNGDRVIWSSDYHTATDATFEVPLNGVEGFVDFVFADDGGHILSRRVVLWKEAGLLPVKLALAANAFQPREQVSVQVSAEGGAPFTQSISAAMKPWTSPPAHIQWLPLKEDPCMDYLTYLGLHHTTADERDILTILADAADVWGTGVERPKTLPADLAANRNYRLDTQLLYSVAHYDGGLRYRNTTAGEYFLLGNADYFRLLGNRPVSRTDSYKYMLETGTPVRDVVRKIKPYDLDGTSIVFTGRRNSLIAQDGAIIVVDGINTGTNASMLDQIVPYDVEKIYVSTDPQDIQRYTGLNSVGLIEITMKRGPKPDKKSTSGENEPFTSPEYKTPGRMKGGRDFRNTLFWNTALTEDPVRKVEFYTGDLVGNVIFSVFVMDAEGRIGYAEIGCDVRL